MFVFETKPYPGAGIQGLAPSKAGALEVCLICIFRAGAGREGCAHLLQEQPGLVLLLPHPRVFWGNALCGAGKPSSSTACRKEGFQTCRTHIALRVFGNMPDFLSVWWDSVLAWRNRQSETVQCFKWILACVISGCSIVTNTNKRGSNTKNTDHVCLQRTGEKKNNKGSNILDFKMCFNGVLCQDFHAHDWGFTQLPWTDLGDL